MAHREVDVPFALATVLDAADVSGDAEVTRCDAALEGDVERRPGPGCLPDGCDVEVQPDAVAVQEATDGQGAPIPVFIQCGPVVEHRALVLNDREV